MAERTLSGEALEVAIDEATTLGGQLFAVRLLRALEPDLRGVDIDVTRAVSQLVFTKASLVEFAELLGITDMQSDLFGPDMVKLIRRKVFNGADEPSDEPTAPGGE